MKHAKYLLAGVAAASLAATPALAAPTARASAPAEKANGIEGGALFAVIGVIAVIALGVVAATNGDDTPASP